MSDLNDLIARNAIMSFNEGLETGARQERERIIKELSENEEAIGYYFLTEKVSIWEKLNFIKEIVKGQQK